MTNWEILLDIKGSDSVEVSKYEADQGLEHKPEFS